METCSLYLNKTLIAECEIIYHIVSIHKKSFDYTFNIKIIKKYEHVIFKDKETDLFIKFNNKMINCYYVNEINNDTSIIDVHLTTAFITDNYYQLLGKESINKSKS